MSVDQGQSPTGPTAPDRTDNGPAEVLADYLSRMRRQRRIYTVVLAVIAVLVFTGAEIVLRTGESAHAHLHSAKSAAPAPPSANPSSTLSVAWSSPDATAIGVPVFQGTVVTYSAHTVTGRNYATGAAVWTYTRTDVSICQVLQEQGTTIVLYELHGNCDEVSAFTTGTGQRSWFRTLDENGNPVNGRPGLAISQSTLLLWTPNFLQAIDPGGGIDRWIFDEPTGCTTVSAVLGSSGVLISQHCTDGDHLMLRDPFVGDDDADKAKVTKWRLDSTDVTPTSADNLVSAVDPKTGALIHYDPSTGKVLGTTPLTVAPQTSGSVNQTPFGTGELITIGATTYSITAAGTVAWTAQVTSVPSLLGSDPIALTPEGIVDFAPLTGARVHSYPIPSTTSSSGVYPVGTGFVVGGTVTTVYH